MLMLRAILSSDPLEEQLEIKHIGLYIIDPANLPQLKPDS